MQLLLLLAAFMIVREAAGTPASPRRVCGRIKTRAECHAERGLCQWLEFRGHRVCFASRPNTRTLAPALGRRALRFKRERDES